MNTTLSIQLHNELDFNKNINCNSLADVQVFRITVVGGHVEYDSVILSEIKTHHWN